VHRDSRDNLELFRERGTGTWGTSGPGEVRYAAVFNLAGTGREIDRLALIQASSRRVTATT
jgi:hypothetical protein